MEMYRLATTTAVYVCMTCSGYPHLILKWDGLESSGQRLISSNNKNKRKAFFSKKKYVSE
jgi:hypothetical protein